MTQDIIEVVNVGSGIMFYAALAGIGLAFGACLGKAVFELLEDFAGYVVRSLSRSR